MAVIGGSQGNFRIELTVVETSSDAVNNTSTASWELRLKTLSGSSYMYGTPTINIYISGKLAHRSSDYRRYETITTDGISVVSGTLTGIEHNDNGTIKSNEISFTWTGSGFTPNDISASGTYDTVVIQRRSIVTGTKANIGETSQLNITRYVSNFTHSIAYSFGSISGYILPDGSTSQTEYVMDILGITFPIPTTWYNEIPNSPDGDCTLTIKTYNGNTQVGNDYVTTFKVIANETMSNPQITANVSDDLNTTIKAITGFSSSNIVLVKGYSTPEITWTITPRNAATITNRTINNVVVTTSPSSLDLTANNIIVEATDSRGFVKDYSVPFTLVDYSTPTFELLGERVDDTSLYVNVQFNGKWFKDTIGNTQNTISRIYWKYAEYGSDTWTVGGNLVANTDYIVNNNGTFYSGNSTEATSIEIGPLPDYTKTYAIMIVVEDVITVGTNDSQRAVTIPGGIPLINWEEDYVNVNGDIRQNNINIIESGNNSNGNYVKYSDGTMMCYKTVTDTVDMTSQWGNLYEGTMQLGDWAEEFISTPIVNVTNTSSTGAMIECFDVAPTTTSAGTVYLARAISYTSTVIVNVFAIGRWMV